VYQKVTLNSRPPDNDKESIKYVKSDPNVVENALGKHFEQHFNEKERGEDNVEILYDLC